MSSESVLIMFWRNFLLLCYKIQYPWLNPRAPSHAVAVLGLCRCQTWTEVQKGFGMDFVPLFVLSESVHLVVGM